MSRPLALALVLLVQACVAESAADRPPVRPPAGSASPAPAPPSLGGPSRPVGATVIPCTVRAEIEAAVTADEIRLKFVLVNAGAQEAQVTLKGTCPGGFIELGGLPAGFDPMHTCRAGACISPNAIATYTIPGGHRSIAIGETTLRAKGDACNKPFPPGSTFLQAHVVTEPRQWHVCSGAQIHIVRDHATGKLRRANLLDEPVPATPPAKQPAPPRTKPAPAKPPRTRPCPACGFACTRGGVPSSRRDPNGCPICACDDPL